MINLTSQVKTSIDAIRHKRFYNHDLKKLYKFCDIDKHYMTSIINKCKPIHNNTPLWSICQILLRFSDEAESGNNYMIVVNFFTIIIFI